MISLYWDVVVIVCFLTSSPYKSENSERNEPETTNRIFYIKKYKKVVFAATDINFQLLYCVWRKFVVPTNVAKLSNVILTTNIAVLLPQMS